VAKKVTSSARPPARPVATGPLPLRRRPGLWVWVATAAAILAVAIAGVLLLPSWRQHRVATLIQSGLPARPARAIPAMLAARLTEAEAQTRAPATALAGLEELGRLYHASGYRSEAEVCWELLRQIQPREPRWCYYLADLRRASSDYDAMASLLERTTTLAPAYAPAWLRLADLQLKTGRLDDARQSYRRRLALLPDDCYASLGLVRVALQQGERAEAKQLAERLVTTTPDFSPGHNLYAEMLSADGDTAGAAKQRWQGRESGRFRDADDPWLDELTAWCFDYEQLCIRGTVDFQTKHGDLGKSCFERAIQLQPAAITAYELLGSLHLEQKDPAGARDIFEQGLKQAGDARPSALFFVHLSRAYRELKQPAEAVRVAREGLARAQPGEEVELYDALGTALGDLGEREAAVEALQAAVDHNPADSNANYNLAIALIALKRLGDAVDALHRSLKLRPTFPPSLALLAQIEIDSGRWQSAAQYLQPLYASHPEMPQAREMMAYWHLRAGSEAESKNDATEAERQYRAGVAIDPRQAELQAKLGTLCLLQGRFADALEPLEAFHRLQPENPQGSLFLGQAYAAAGRQQEARQILTEGIRIAERAGNATTARYCREVLNHLTPDAYP